MDNYEKLAKDYEALNPKEDIMAQKDFFKSIVEKYKVKTCLDCACGLGWHLYLLDELGVKCSGSDLSDEMIEICKYNLKGKDIDLKVGDYRKLSAVWENRYDMILCVSSALNHMLEDEDIIAALNSMHDRLEENGILIVFTGVSDALAANKPKLIPAKLYKDQAFYHFIEYFEDRAVFNILNVKKTEDSFSHSLNSMTLSLLTKERFEKCASRTAFSEVSIYGDFDFSPYKGEESSRLICILRK